MSSDNRIMPKKVLDVGQCDLDHSNITALLKANFEVEVARAHSRSEAISMATVEGFDLVLVNRLFDADGSEGMAVVSDLKTNERTADVPVMIVSNYEEAQVAAVEAGAVRGFGKSALGSDATLDLLKSYLA